MAHQSKTPLKLHQSGSDFSKCVPAVVHIMVSSLTSAIIRHNKRVSECIPNRLIGYLFFCFFSHINNHCYTLTLSYFAIFTTICGVNHLYSEV